MCGRYALALRPSQIRQILEDDGMSVDDAPLDEGDDAPRSSYNFAPGYHGIVYRADTPDWGSGPRDKSQVNEEAEAATKENNPVKYKMQSMKWGLVPFWTKRNPDYGTIMRTINCRDDSLSTPGGMWASMKTRKRCIVIAQGFFEWLKTGPKDKLPHFIKRADGHLMCFAGLWDCVQYEGSEDKNYTYTIITTDSNKQLKFLHDRMPVILEPGSDNMKTWLDPSRKEWTRDLQSLLRPFDGRLEVYPVTKDVGKVGNNSPSFIIPLDSKENKSNIANFFANASKKKGDAKDIPTEKETEIQDEPTSDSKGTVEAKDHESSASLKRKASDSEKVNNVSAKLAKKAGSGKISATKNQVKSPTKSRVKGTPKITNFFTK
ncbi:Fc.00g102990.m01.CDS01 [Cosmosporella sp. VM-42]